MSTSDSQGNMDKLSDFIKDLQKNHLTQVTATKYENNPLLLGKHYAINFTPAPVEIYAVEDPAQKSMVLLLAYKPEYKSSNFGNLLIPKTMTG